MDVKNTMTMLDWDLKIHRLRKMPTLQKIIPRINSLPGFCSALKGVTKDSRTMISIILSLLFINLLEKKKKTKSLNKDLFFSKG
jgi:hypothetical protein